MTKLHWGILAAIAITVLLTQLPHHDHDKMSGHEDHTPATAGAAAPRAGSASVTLAVTGMT